MNETVDPIRALRKAPTGGTVGAETRSAILDATIEIMRNQGYAAVSSRRIAARAGLKSKLVHYYFRNMDELFLAAYQRIEDEHFAELANVVASSTPLRAMWRLNMDCTNTSMVFEFLALARHRKVLRAEIARSSERFRLLQAALVKRESGGTSAHGISMPPTILSVLCLGLTRLLAMDSFIGVEAGRDETLRWAEAVIDSIEDGKPFSDFVPNAPHDGDI